MAWLKTLAETYDVYADLAGKEKNGQPILLPISHLTFNAQIEVSIDIEGNFKGAKKLDKGDDIVTIIPVTEDSAARSSGIAPHPLCDKLCYIAGDYTFYTGDNKEKYYEAYIEQLRDWAVSEQTHPMVQAVYHYLRKKSLICDLTAAKVLETDDKGELTDQVKIQGLGQTGANVRFVVYDNYKPMAVWKNLELYRKYGEYYQQKLGERRLCYASGEREACSDKHPSKIRNSADKAKLISGNDELGFTYRGRFVSKEQAVAVGYDTSQKAHNVLRWLIQKQGYTRDESAIVCWMINRDMQIPEMMKDSVNAYKKIDDFDFKFDDIEDSENRSDNGHDTGKYYAEQFNKAVNGYVGKFKEEDRVAVIALDAATTGRLSVVYYDEMGGKQYMDAILHWQGHCKWRRTIRLENPDGGSKRITCECTPSPRDIALAAFGVQRAEWLEADSKLLKETVRRLLPCITRKDIKIPTDIVKAAANRASMPQAMSDFVWRNDVLCVVCAMIRFNYEKEGRIMSDFLKDNEDDRNVLFGRLLAVYDYMEQRALFEKDEFGKFKEMRTTNAKRYWNAYSSRPAITSKTIKQNLIAYEKKLGGYELARFENWTSEIMALLAGNGFDNAALSEQYLPGYYLQMKEMKEAFQRKNNQGGEDDE